MTDEHETGETSSDGSALADVDQSRRDFLKKMAGVAGVFAAPTVIAVTLDEDTAAAQTADGEWLYDDRPGPFWWLRRLLYILRRIFGFGR